MKLEKHRPPRADSDEVRLLKKLLRQMVLLNERLGDIQRLIEDANG